jgi:repressor LexA
MHAPTRRQREVLDFIIRYIDSHGYRPSYAVIARQLGLRSRAGINRIVRDLESNGLLARVREDGHFFIDVGKVRETVTPAGIVYVEWLDAPSGDGMLESWQNGPLALPEFMLGFQTSERIRAYRVPDNAMEADDIFEDDVALIELRQFVRDGDRVVAVLNNTITVLRKYFRSGAHIELRPAGDRSAENVIRMAADHVLIKGVQRGLLRPVM